MKTEWEIREKLKEMLQVDGNLKLGQSGTPMIFSKSAACKALLWALGENDDDRWMITSKPGPPVDARAKARN